MNDSSSLRARAFASEKERSNLFWSKIASTRTTQHSFAMTTSFKCGCPGKRRGGAKRLFILPADQRMTAVDLQFLIDVLDMIFHRFQRDIKPDSHFFVGQPLLNGLHYLRLARGQLLLQVFGMLRIKIFHYLPRNAGRHRCTAFME